jgi:2-haloacid dehalogenase
MADRWSTFDCYGTLVDWNGGIRHELARLFGEAEVARLLESYHRMEPQVQAQEPSLSYREVMARVLAELALEHGEPLPKEERDALGRSLPDWPVFAEVPAALAEAHERGWKLAILSNTDRDFIAASMERIGAPFELAIVADEIDSYKPAHRHWEVFYERTGADRDRHVHVAQSHFHDIVPAGQLGIPSIWINRLGERADPPPDRELRDLSGLADALDELVAEKT